MALGKQFNQTYWENPDSGDITAYSPRGYNSDANYPKRNNYNAQIASWKNPDNEDIEGYQGLLFNPYSGTGVREDPLVSKKDRRDTINKVLRVGDVGGNDPVKSGRDNQMYLNLQNQDFKNYKNTGLFRKVLNVVNRNVNSIGTKKPAEERKLISDSLMHSNMPMQEIQKLNNTVQKPSIRARGGLHPKNTGGSYYSGSKRITIARGLSLAATSDVLLHELGHAQDPGIGELQDWKQYQKADPLKEGVADGYKDAMRTGNGSRDFLPELHNEGGYTSNSKIWENPTQRALYAATRAHQSTNPNQHNPVPRRSWYGTSVGSSRYRSSKDNLKHSDEAMLHHLVSNNPHLYDILDKEHYDTIDKDGNYELDKPVYRSLGDAAREASQRHLDRTYGPAPEQLKLFED